MTIDFEVSPQNSALYSWRMSILCFVPVTMTSSSTSSEGMERSKSILVKADATFIFSKDADAVVVLHLIAKQSVIVDVGTLSLMTRFLCTLSLIFCSNEHCVHVGFGGKFGRGLVTSKVSIANKGCNQIAIGTKNHSSSLVG